MGKPYAVYVGSLCVDGPGSVTPAKITTVRPAGAMRITGWTALVHAKIGASTDPGITPGGLSQLGPSTHRISSRCGATAKTFESVFVDVTITSSVASTHGLSAQYKNGSAIMLFTLTLCEHTCSSSSPSNTGQDPHRVIPVGAACPRPQFLAGKTVSEGGLETPDTQNLALISRGVNTETQQTRGF